MYAPPAVERRGDAKHARSLRADGRGWGRVRRVVRKVFAHQRRRRAPRKRRHETIRGPRGRRLAGAGRTMARAREGSRGDVPTTKIHDARRAMWMPRPSPRQRVDASERHLGKADTETFSHGDDWLPTRFSDWRCLGVTTPTGARASRRARYVPHGASADRPVGERAPHVRREPPLEVQARRGSRPAVRRETHALRTSASSSSQGGERSALLLRSGARMGSPRNASPSKIPSTAEPPESPEVHLEGPRCRHRLRVRLSTSARCGHTSCASDTPSPPASCARDRTAGSRPGSGIHRQEHVRDACKRTLDDLVPTSTSPHLERSPRRPPLSVETSARATSGAGARRERGVVVGERFGARPGRHPRRDVARSTSRVSSPRATTASSPSWQGFHGTHSRAPGRRARGVHARTAPSVEGVPGPRRSFAQFSAATRTCTPCAPRGRRTSARATHCSPAPRRPAEGGPTNRASQAAAKARTKSAVGAEEADGRCPARRRGRPTTTKPERLSEQGGAKLGDRFVSFRRRCLVDSFDRVHGATTRLEFLGHGSLRAPSSGELVFETRRNPDDEGTPSKGFDATRRSATVRPCATTCRLRHKGVRRGHVIGQQHRVRGASVLSSLRRGAGAAPGWSTGAKRAGRGAGGSASTTAAGHGQFRDEAREGGHRERLPARRTPTRVRGFSGMPLPRPLAFFRFNMAHFGHFASSADVQF